MKTVSLLFTTFPTHCRQLIKVLSAYALNVFGTPTVYIQLSKHIILFTS